MSIPELRQADNGVYHIYWTERGRSKRVSTRQRDMAAAQAFFGQWLLMEQSAPPPNAMLGPTMTISELWGGYELGHIHGVAAPQTLYYNWKNLEQHFGGLSVSQITQDAFDSYAEKRQSGKIGKPSKLSTVRKELNALVACLNWHADAKRGKDRKLDRSHIPVVTLPPEGDPRDRWLRVEELRAIFAAAKKMRRGKRLSRGERFLWLALETAARRDAILELTWDRVDFEVGVIHYNVPGRKKTKKRRASVPISSALRPVLERAFKEREGDLVMDNMGDVWATIQLIAIEAGLGGGQEKPTHSRKPRATGVSPHVLRHTAATWMARRGVPMFTIAKILGNSMATVEKTYAKWCPDDPEHTVDLISGGKVEASE